MKRIDVPMIRSLDPCYDTTDKVSEDWSGTVLDVLALENVKAQDKFWLVLREEFLSAKIMRLFAASCARDVQHLIKDERSIKAIDVAERYAHGFASEEELAAAWATACAAASDASRAAVWAAVCAAASDASRATAWAAVRDAQVNKLREMILSMPEEVRS